MPAEEALYGQGAYPVGNVRTRHPRSFVVVLGIPPPLRTSSPYPSWLLARTGTDPQAERPKKRQLGGSHGFPHGGMIHCFQGQHLVSIPRLFPLAFSNGFYPKVRTPKDKQTNMLSFNPWPPSAILAHSNMAKHRQWRFFAVT